MNTIASPETHAVAERLRLCLPRLAARWHEESRLADLALDSLDTVELLCVVHEEFGVRLQECELHQEQTVGGLLAVIGQRLHA